MERGEERRGEDERGGEEERGEDKRGEERRGEEERSHKAEENDEDDGGDEGCTGSVRTQLQQERGGASVDRKCVPGVVYLGHIPPHLRPKHMRNMLSPYGEIGRIFLQPEDRVVKQRKVKAGSRSRSFTEGWVEFRDKRVAKRVAASLHNTPMGHKKRSRFHADLWCIKYLHRFQWVHLSERRAYEQTVLNQRLRTEVSQAKRETGFYLSAVDKSRSLKHKGKQWDFTQRFTEEEIRLKKQKKKDSISQKHLDKARLIQQKSQSNVSLLAKIFNSNNNDR